MYARATPGPALSRPSHCTRRGEASHDERATCLDRHLGHVDRTVPGLLAYNSTITRYEENQLFLAELNANEQQRQTSISKQVNKLGPYIRVLGTLSAIMTVAIIAIYTWDAWQKIQL